jgi:L-ascorbate metabolism protein UlaG (beta-lactamase superfamily)
MKVVAWIGGGLVLALAALAHLLFATHEAPPVDPAWARVGSAHVPPGAVTVRWTGCATLVFGDGETTIVIDGWFSRPGPYPFLVDRIEPDLEAIRFGMAHNELEQAAVVFPVHSHYDHAMDAPEVARRTGAVLMGSESTAMIGRGWGLPEEQIRVVEDRERIDFGRFTLVPIESRHFQFADPKLRERALAHPEIEAPLVPPASPFDYRVGTAYALSLEHPRGRILIQGSAGYIEGGLEGIGADVVFLGIGGLGSQTADYREAYWRETVDRVGARTVVPIHWDGLMGSIEGPFRGPLRGVALLMGGGEGTLAFLKQKQAEGIAHGLRIETLPRYDPVVLFDD